MANDSFDDRRKALEEHFFLLHDKALVEKMKDAALKATSKGELMHLTGITNEQVLDALAALKLGGAATLVMSLFPIVEVAWADGKLDEKERRVILELAKSIGIDLGSSAFNYLSRWLDEKPEANWHQLWADYVKALVAQMKPDDKAMLKATVLGRARVVAETSGGFMGVAFRISAAETRMLARLESAFD